MHHDSKWVLLGMLTLVSVAIVAHSGSQGPIFMAAVAVASFASSIAGFAFSAICGAILFHLADDPVTVVQIMMTCSIANQASMTFAIRKDIDWPRLCPYLLGGWLGLGPGIWLLFHLERGVYTRVLGLGLLVYGSYMLLRKPLVIRRPGWPSNSLIGFLGGVTGGAAGFPGASVTIWCGMMGWDKRRQRAIFQPFILVMQISALLAVTMVRRGTLGGLGFDGFALVFVPASLLGTVLGMAFYRRLSDNQFTRAVNMLLIVSGATYLM